MNSRNMSISLQDVTTMNESRDVKTNHFNSMISLSLSDLTNPLNLKPAKTNSLSLITTLSNDPKQSRINTIKNINSKKFKHVESKVKNYIKQIKISNDKQRLQVSRSVPSSPLSNDEDNSLPDIETLLNTISALKDELYKKDELINTLQESYMDLLKKHNESETRMDRFRFESIENLSSKTPKFLSSNSFSPLLTNKFISISDNNLNIMNKRIQRRSNDDFLPFELNKYKKQEERNNEFENIDSKSPLHNKGNGNYSNLEIVINSKTENKSVQTENPVESNTSSKLLIDCIKEIEIIVEGLGKRSDQISKQLSKEMFLNSDHSCPHAF